MEPRARMDWENPSFKRKRDNYARKLKRNKLINYLRNELQSCSAHGLPYIMNEDIHWFERTFWAISFLLGLLATIGLLRMQFLRYADTPLVTSIEMDYINWNVSFPAITVCPMYKIEDEDLADFVKYNNETLDNTGVNLDTYLRAIATVSYDTADVVDFENVVVSDLLLPKDYSVLAAMMYKKFDNNSLTTSSNTHISVNSAMTEMGMCHVINSNVAVLDNPTKWSTAKYSRNNIDLTFYEQGFFVQLLNYADFYKVFVHSPNELIQSTSPSYTSKTNNYIEFGVRVWSTRLADTLRTAPISVRKCRFLDEPISKRYPIYTLSHCLVECRIKMILKLCDCLPHLYKPLSHERVCNLTELPCWVQHLREIVTLSVSNDTLADFPDTTDLPRSSRDCNCDNDCDSDVFMKDRETFIAQDNYNSVRVAISSFPKVRIVKDVIVNLHDIILRSGGVVNLCLGTSVISLMELLMLFVKIILASASEWISKIFNKFHRFLPQFKLITKKANNKGKKHF